MYLIFFFIISSFYGYGDANWVPNVVVAKDGSGKFNSIQAAIASAPNYSPYHYVIYIKEGVYFGPIFVGKEKRNIVLIGDGKGKTILASNRSSRSGYGIRASAALDVETDNFYAAYLTITNTAGPEGKQAVALHTKGTYIAFYYCSIEGYQDTLYTQFGWAQFFSYCDIYGTVDFIFGNAKVVVQNSNIYARRRPEPFPNTITAQGRKTQDDTAIVIHNCTLKAAAGYDYRMKTFLGRPWKYLSRTVIMESYLDRHIDPRGWLEWEGDFALRTLYYVEYRNRGPRSDTRFRVRWPGYHVLTRREDVLHFTVDNFIYGRLWLPALGVPYIGGLLS